MGKKHLYLFLYKFPIGIICSFTEKGSYEFVRFFKIYYLNPNFSLVFLPQLKTFFSYQSYFLIGPVINSFILKTPQTLQ